MKQPSKFVHAGPWAVLATLALLALPPTAAAGPVEDFSACMPQSTPPSGSIIEEPPGIYVLADPLGERMIGAGVVPAELYAGTGSNTIPDYGIGATLYYGSCAEELIGYISELLKVP